MPLDRVVNRAIATPCRRIDDHRDARVVNGDFPSNDGLRHRCHTDEVGPVPLQPIDFGCRFESRTLCRCIHPAIVAIDAGTCGRIEQLAA